MEPWCTCKHRDPMFSISLSLFFFKSFLLWLSMRFQVSLDKYHHLIATNSNSICNKGTSISQVSGNLGNHSHFFLHLDQDSVAHIIPSHQYNSLNILTLTHSTPSCRRCTPSPTPCCLAGAGDTRQQAPSTLPPSPPPLLPVPPSSLPPLFFLLSSEIPHVASFLVFGSYRRRTHRPHCLLTTSVVATLHEPHPPPSSSPTSGNAIASSTRCRRPSPIRRHPSLPVSPAVLGEPER